MRCTPAGGLGSGRPRAGRRRLQRCALDVQARAVAHMRCLVALGCSSTNAHSPGRALSGLPRRVDARVSMFACFRTRCVRASMAAAGACGVGAGSAGVRRRRRLDEHPMRQGRCRATDHARSARRRLGSGGSGSGRSSSRSSSSSDSSSSSRSIGIHARSSGSNKRGSQHSGVGVGVRGGVRGDGHRRCGDVSSGAATPRAAAPATSDPAAAAASAVDAPHPPPPWRATLQQCPPAHPD
eukprot:364475-Chlamydomonas_euryale.AAC.9